MVVGHEWDEVLVVDHECNQGLCREWMHWMAGWMDRWMGALEHEYDKELRWLFIVVDTRVSPH